MAPIKHFFLITQVRSDSIIQYLQSESQLLGQSTYKSLNHSLISNHLKSNTANFENKPNYSGLVSPSVKKRIRSKLDLLIQISPKRKIYNPVSNNIHHFQLAFLTFTIPAQDHLPNHKIVMRDCFKPMLQYLKRKEGVTDYVWKAELQGNGTIHYHLATNRFIHYSDLRSNWNRLLEKAGLLDKFKSEYGHNNPNSTDIHSTKTTKGAKIYISKYMAKNDKEERRIEGKVWDCSQNLKLSTHYSDQLSSASDDYLDKLVEEGKIKKIQTDYVTIYNLDNIPSKSILTPNQQQHYITHLESIKNFKYNKMEEHKSSKSDKPQPTNKRLSATINQAKQLELRMPPGYTRNK